jgi:hypothetical protein
MLSDEVRFRVKGRCPVLLNDKVAVVTAADEDEAVRKAKQAFGTSTLIDKVEEYHGEEDDG